ncbi:MAG: chaperonin GroES [Patescibacteria group bacterium]|jgi:chaperonin GroES|nr:chaperonin GroES [Patescibacteria group bacterium]
MKREVKKESSKKQVVIPLSDRVLVRPLSKEEVEKKSKSGILVPDEINKEKSEQGTVVAVGPGKWNEDGEERIPMTVKVGDRVIFSGYGFDEIKLEGEEYYMISEGNILAIIN